MFQQAYMPSPRRHAAQALTSRYFLKTLIFIAVLFFAALFSSPARSQDLIVQADHWCPYNCQPGTAEPGYVIEMLQAVFEQSGRKIKYELVPWDRALLQARAGLASAAIAATQRQAEKYGLLIGHESVGYSRDCLYVAASRQQEFSKAGDLNTLKSVAIVSGYTYPGDFGTWLARPENRRKILIQRGEHPAEVSVKNLALGRLDGVIENSMVMGQITAKLGMEKTLAAVQCQPQTPIYIAFSPKLPNVREAVKELDEGIAKLRQSRQLTKILAKYGQTDWK